MHKPLIPPTKHPFAPRAARTAPAFGGASTAECGSAARGFVVSFPQAQGREQLAARGRPSAPSSGAAATLPPPVLSGRAALRERSGRQGGSTCLAYRVGRRATADSAIPTRPTPCPHVSAVGARCGSASLGGGWVRGAPGRQLAPAERARGRFLTSCLGAGERPLPRATRPLDAVGPLPQDERGRSERGARRRSKGRESDPTLSLIHI